MRISQNHDDNELSKNWNQFYKKLHSYFLISYAAWLEIEMGSIDQTVKKIKKDQKRSIGQKVKIQGVDKR